MIYIQNSTWYIYCFFELIKFGNKISSTQNVKKQVQNALFYFGSKALIPPQLPLSSNLQINVAKNEYWLVILLNLDNSPPPSNSQTPNNSTF